MHTVLKKGNASHYYYNLSHIEPIQIYVVSSKLANTNYASQLFLEFLPLTFKL